MNCRRKSKEQSSFNIASKNGLIKAFQRAFDNDEIHNWRGNRIWKRSDFENDEDDKLELRPWDGTVVDGNGHCSTATSSTTAKRWRFDRWAPACGNCCGRRTRRSPPTAPSSSAPTSSSPSSRHSIRVRFFSFWHRFESSRNVDFASIPVMINNLE